MALKGQRLKMMSKPARALGLEMSTFQSPIPNAQCPGWIFPWGGGKERTGVVVLKSPAVAARFDVQLQCGLQNLLVPGTLEN